MSAGNQQAVTGEDWAMVQKSQRHFVFKYEAGLKLTTGDFAESAVGFHYLTLPERKVAGCELCLTATVTLAPLRPVRPLFF